MQSVLRAAFEIIAHLGHGVDRVSLIHALRPKEREYPRVFRGAIASWARAAYATVWTDPVVPMLDPARTQLDLWGAHAADLAGGKNAAPYFPGGYADIAADLLPEPIWLCWEFREHGHSDGTTGDGLVWLGDRFAWFPKPWHVLPRAVAPHLHWAE